MPSRICINDIVRVEYDESDNDNDVEHEEHKEAGDEVDSEYQCRVCLEILYRPITFPCGHSACEHCFLRMYPLRSVQRRVCIGGCQTVISGSVTCHVNLVLSHCIQRTYPKQYNQRELNLKDLAIEDVSACVAPIPLDDSDDDNDDNDRLQWDDGDNRRQVMNAAEPEVPFDDSDDDDNDRLQWDDAGNRRQVMDAAEPAVPLLWEEPLTVVLELYQHMKMNHPHNVPPRPWDMLKRLLPHLGVSADCQAPMNELIDRVFAVGGVWEGIGRWRDWMNALWRIPRVKRAIEQRLNEESLRLLFDVLLSPRMTWNQHRVFFYMNSRHVRRRCLLYMVGFIFVYLILKLWLLYEFHSPITFQQVRAVCSNLSFSTLLSQGSLCSGTILQFTFIPMGLAATFSAAQLSFVEPMFTPLALILVLVIPVYHVPLLALALWTRSLVDNSVLSTAGWSRPTVVGFWILLFCSSEASMAIFLLCVLQQSLSSVANVPKMLRRSAELFFMLPN